MLPNELKIERPRGARRAGGTEEIYFLDPVEAFGPAGQGYGQQFTAPENYNQFGYNVGGPFYIPGKFNNQKNKIFWYLSYAPLRRAV